MESSPPPPDREDPRVVLAGIHQVRDLLVEMGRVRELGDLLRLVVARIAALEHVAVARIWQVRPGDRCVGCELREGCPDQTRCLHAVASLGHSIRDESVDWSDLVGLYSRIPLSPGRRIARIFLSGEPHVVRDFAVERDWIEDEMWRRLPDAEHFRAFIEGEEIVGFLGCPLVHGEEVLGVIGVYMRAPVLDEGPVWLRIVADQLANGIVMTRTFARIKDLNDHLSEENAYLRQEVRDVQAFGEIVGQSTAIQHIAEQVELVAPTDANVLITGASGTGKELVAREIHRRSQRKDEPMVRVNCASIPRELYESEFFGHVKGAFTGAIKDRAGRFELAAGGTLFLDEVGEIPLELQSKLLRALQEGQYERVGEDETREVDVRIVAATNRDLLREIASNHFRQDLYYRLAVFPIEVAPLCERKEDIRLLAEHFIERACRRWNRSAPRLTFANVHALQGYAWPGNVRELQNVVERALITSPKSKLVFELPNGHGPAHALTPQQPRPGEEAEERILTEAEIRKRERDNLKRALDRTNWKVYGDDGAAVLLGVKPTTLASRIKKLGLQPPR